MGDNGFSEIAERSEIRRLVSKQKAHDAFEWLKKFALEHPEIPEASHALLAWRLAAMAEPKEPQP